MMLRPALRRQAATAGAVVLTVGGIALYPRRTVHAEAPPASPSRRKPIYNDNPTQSTSTSTSTTSPALISQQSHSNPPSTSSSSSSSSSATPTDQLAAQVRQVRLVLYDRSLAAENAFNDALSRVLHVESRFTSTLASLGPPPESGERLLPGSVYVLVAAMAGSIVARNRGFVLRATTPLALGTVAAYSLLPVTMRNVGDLVWEYERRFPALAEEHVRVRAAVEESWTQALAHSRQSREWMEGKIGEGRRSLEQWISKGT